MPYFWLALIAISLFSVTLGWFPSSGSYDRSMAPNWSLEFIGSVIYYGVLPAMTIVMASVAGWILGMRNMMVTVSSEDYVTVAQAKGLSERRVKAGTPRATRSCRRSRASRCRSASSSAAR